MKEVDDVAQRAISTPATVEKPRVRHDLTPRLVTLDGC